MFELNSFRISWRTSVVVLIEPLAWNGSLHLCIRCCHTKFLTKIYCALGRSRWGGKKGSLFSPNPLVYIWDLTLQVKMTIVSSLISGLEVIFGTIWNQTFTSRPKSEGSTMDTLFFWGRYSSALGTLSFRLHQAITFTFACPLKILLPFNFDTAPVDV